MPHLSIDVCTSTHLFIYLITNNTFVCLFVCLPLQPVSFELKENWFLKHIANQSKHVCFCRGRSEHIVLTVLLVLSQWFGDSAQPQVRGLLCVTVPIVLGQVYKKYKVCKHILIRPTFPLLLYFLFIASKIQILPGST